MIYWVYEAYLKQILYLSLIQPKGMNFNRSPSKNPAIKTPPVMSFLLGVSVHFSPLAAFSCQGSSKNFHYHFWVSLLFQCWHVCPLLVLVCMQVSSSSVCPLIVVKITQKLQKSTKNLILSKTGIPVLEYSLKKIKVIF